MPGCFTALGDGKPIFYITSWEMWYLPAPVFLPSPKNTPPITIFPGATPVILLLISLRRLNNASRLPPPVSRGYPLFFSRREIWKKGFTRMMSCPHPKAEEVRTTPRPNLHLHPSEGGPRGTPGSQLSSDLEVGGWGGEPTAAPGPPGPGQGRGAR